MPGETKPTPADLRHQAAQLRLDAIASKDPELRREYVALAAKLDKQADLIERGGSG